jgi:hypothetical protein
LAESAKRLIEDRIASLGVGHLFALHDWSSHAADAFGLMAISYSDRAPRDFNRKLEYRVIGIV